MKKIEKGDYSFKHLFSIISAKFKTCFSITSYESRKINFSNIKRSYRRNIHLRIMKNQYNLTIDNLQERNRK